MRRIIIIRAPMGLQQSRLDRGGGAPREPQARIRVRPRAIRAIRPRAIRRERCVRAWRRLNTMLAMKDEQFQRFRRVMRVRGAFAGRRARASRACGVFSWIGALCARV